jgi:hypothetical protein
LTVGGYIPNVDAGRTDVERLFSRAGSTGKVFGGGGVGSL